MLLRKRSFATLKKDLGNQKWDAVICGAGLIGISTAYNLIRLAKEEGRRPLRIAIVEREKPLGLTSSASTGMEIHKSYYYYELEKCLN